MKELITAMNISEARKAGLREVSVSPGALITPQARDDAKSYGIALVMRESPTPASTLANASRAAIERPSNLSGIKGLGEAIFASVPQAEPSVAGSSRSVQPVRGLGGPVTTDARGANVQEADALGRAVLERLDSLLAPRGGIAAFPGLASTIESIIAAYSGVGAPLPASSLAGVPGVDVALLGEKAAEQKTTQRAQGEVEVEEALAPGADGPGVTRLSWSASSFAWTFEFDEVLAVTSGEVEIKSAASPMAGLVLSAGDALRVRAGTSLTLSARGNASCICSSWPSGKSHG